MKKILKFSCAVLILLSSSVVSAQHQVERGDVLINAGIGLGYYYAGGVPLLLSAEFPVSDFITVGPYLGYTSYGYNWGFGYRYRYTFLDIGVRGSYHFNELFEIRNEALDVYGGAFLGYLASSYSGDNVPYDDPYSGGVRFGIHAGVRYYFAEQIAGYAELGYGIAPLSIGVTFKL